MIRKLFARHKGIILPAFAVGILLSLPSCTDTCTKCIESKPAPTTFSNTLNAINHSIPVDQAMTMISNFSTQQDNLLDSAHKHIGTLPLYETFNLKAIDSLICQKNTIGFRIYMALDAQQKVRFVLVGVDGDGKDIMMRTKENPGASASSLGDVSVMVDEAGQRWP